MKNERQYKDSARFTMIGYVGIIVIITTLLLGFGEYSGFNKEVRDGLSEDPRPLTPNWNYMHPNQWTKKDSTDYVDSLKKTDTLFNSIFIISETVDSIGAILDRIEKKLDSLPEEYHGKEGQNGEWGEYVQTENFDDFDQGPCGGDDWNEMHYIESDEYQMWIGGNGDTIWE